MNGLKKRRIVVVGGMAAGMRAALSARRAAGDSVSVTVLDAAPRVAYCLCSIPFFISGALDDRELFTTSAKAISREQNIEVLTGHRVTKAAPGRLAGVDNEGGKPFSLPWEVLILATGGEPVVPAVPGMERVRAYPVRGLRDARAARRALAASPGSAVLVLGGGYGGCETAAALCRAGFSVILMEREANLFPDGPPFVSDLVRAELAGHGIRVMTGMQLTQVRPAAGRITVDTSRGTIPVDHVMFSTGVRPRVELALQLGLRRGAAGAVLVDRRQQTSMRNVYAAGDCAVNYDTITGKKRYLPLGVASIRQGRCAGSNAAGHHALYPGTLGARVLRLFDLEIGRIGLTAAEAGANFSTPVSVTVGAPWYSGGSGTEGPVTVEMTADGAGHRILGMTIAGRASVAKKIDAVSAAVTAGMRVEDMLKVEFGYSPPVSPILDPVLLAVRKLSAALKKRK